MTMQADALEVLEATSRTFYVPIARLPDRLRQAVTSAYLCMRAIDQIEDHPTLDNAAKAQVLRAISHCLQECFEADDLACSMGRHAELLPEVTTRIGEWALLAPASIAPRIWDAIAAMAERMAQWADCNWQVESERDLDRYTFGVAGAVGLLLSDLWAWYDGTQTERLQAIGFGRGLQSVNILRNREEDLARGVDFFPDGWGDEAMQGYARVNLGLADAYTRSLPSGPALEFCAIPLTLAYATLDALVAGRAKLSRIQVIEFIGRSRQ